MADIIGVINNANGNWHTAKFRIYALASILLCGSELFKY